MANVLIEESTMSEIADAIRSKNGTTEGILPRDMASAIEGISSGGADDVAKGIIDKSITEISNSEITSVGDYVFYCCFDLTGIDFPNATSIGTSAFYACRNLTIVDFPKVTNIKATALNYAEKLHTLILRSTTMVTLGSATALRSTAIHAGTGYIYVPRSLVDSYKTATNWTSYTNQFRALEDYTVDGTITGALDTSKI